MSLRGKTAPTSDSSDATYLLIKLLKHMICIQHGYIFGEGPSYLKSGVPCLSRKYQRLTPEFANRGRGREGEFGGLFKRIKCKKKKERKLLCV